MTSETERVQKLRALLERVQRNAVSPRPAAAVAKNHAPVRAGLEARFTETGATRVDIRPPHLDTAQPLAGDSMVTMPGRASAETQSTHPREPSVSPRATPPRPIAEPFPHAPSLEVESPSQVPAEPPAEHSPADSRSDFEATSVSGEAEFERSAPPSIGEIETPPISTEQQRDEDDAAFEAASAPRTPPPESGPQVSIPPKEAELSGLTAQPEGPTMEQLGSTIDLDGDGTPPADLELEVGAESTRAPSVAADEFEAELPSSQYAGVYDHSLELPSTARDDLEQHDVQESEREARVSQPPSVPPVPQRSVTGLELGDAEVVGRPRASGGSPVVYARPRGGGAVASFVQRLDASLALRL